MNAIGKRRAAARFLPLLFLVLVPALAFANASFDPNDSLYRYLDAWAGRGLIANIPPVRPYPAATLRQLLDAVINRGNAEDARLAREFLAQVTGSSFHAAVRIDGAWRDVLPAGRLSVGGAAFWELSPQAAAGLRASAWMADRGAEALLPRGEGSDLNLMEDPSQVGPDIFGRAYRMATESDSSLSVVAGSLSVQAGLSRSSFGPFFANGLVLGPQAPVAGNLIATWVGDGMSWYWGLFGLTHRLPSGAKQTNKFLAFHGFEVRPMGWLTIDLFETVVWIDRFEPLYLIPVSSLFYLQSMSGFADNCLAGVSGTARLAPGMTARALVYFDDILKFAVQAGLAWTPEAGFARSLSIDYTAVMPYAYTHYLTAPAGGDNYTHAGVNLGPALEPNSDRWELKAFFTPLESLEVEAVGRIIRHGNASEDIPGGGDGTIQDHGYVGGVPTFPWSILQWPIDLRFLSQDVIETSIQAGVTGALRLRTSWGALVLSARGLLEYRINDGLVSGANAFHPWACVGVTYEY